MQTQVLAKLSTPQSIVDVKNHPLLARLANEVANDKIYSMCPHARYDRTHNRHNRGQ